jgi:uroporphyrinogen-III synthase
MRVVLTRAGPEAGEWAGALDARGFDVLQLPLIGVGPAPDAAALDRVRASLGRYEAVMFVSGNAARGLLAGGVEWPQRVRAWATGPGTVNALRAAGVPPDSIDAPPMAAGQFDSEHLWAVVKGHVRPGWRVLLVRGADASGQVAGRDWLAQRLHEAGAEVETVAAYSRAVPSWTAAQRMDALRAAADGSVWLFSSSEAVGNLRQLLPDARWSGAHALATHERIAAAARGAGFGVVRTSRPDLSSVIAALESSG